MIASPLPRAGSSRLITDVIFCLFRVTPNGCYIVTPCDLSPWIGNEIILTSTLAGTDNILEIAPTYPDCPTRVFRSITPYRRVVLTNDQALVSMIITGPNSITVIAQTGAVTYVA